MKNYHIAIKSKWIDKDPITNNNEAYTGYNTYCLWSHESPVKMLDLVIRDFKAEFPKREIISITIEVI